MAKNQRLDATITIGSVLEKTVNKHFNVIRTGLDSVGDEIKQVTDRQRELSKQRQVLERQGRSVDELDREYEQLGRTLDDLRRKQERFERAQLAANAVGQSFSNMNREIGRVARNASIVIGAASAAVFGVASSTAEAASEIGRFAQISNTSTKDFQRMAFAAESVGIESDKLADILKDVNDRVGDFLQTGGGPMADFFENVAPQVGVTAEQFKNLSGADALQLYVSTLEKANLSQQDMTFYLEAMASDTTALIPLLSDGGVEMNRLADGAERAGRMIDEKTITASREFKGALRDAKGSVEGLRNTIGSALIPVVTEAMDSFTEFMASNQTEVRAFADTVATKLGEALPHIVEVASGIGTVAGEIGGAITDLADFVGGWENFGVIVGGVLASKAILSIGSFAGSVFRLGRAMWALGPALPLVATGVRAIGIAMAANPIGATITVIALGAGLIIANWEKIKTFFEPLLNWLGEKFDWVMEKLQPLLDGLSWVQEKGAGAIGAVTGFFGGGDEESPANFNPVTGEGRPTERAIGGAFARGPLLVGERGPELMYPSQGGFIAHNRALERMAGLADRLRSAGALAGQQAAQVTQNITINATGMSVEQLVDELERRKREAQQGALFDGASGYGQYGGAYG